MKTFTWNILKEPFEKDKVVSDVVKLVFMALKNIFEKTFTEVRLSYAVFLRGCRYLDLTKNVLSEELNS